MKSIMLSEEEILSIQSFLHEISNIPMIECVYLVSYLEENTKLEKIDVITIKNQSLYYNEKLTGKAISRDTKNEQNIFNITINNFKNLSKNSRLYFSKADDFEYCLSLMHSREVIAEKSLVSGEILFDRFGDKEENKQRASCLLRPYPNILQIENIEQLKNNKENIVLKRTK